MVRQKQTTVNQPSRSDQEFVGGRRNVAYNPGSKTRRLSGSAEAIRATIPVDQLQSSQGEQRKTILDALKKNREKIQEHHEKSHGNEKKTIALDIDGVMANFNAAMRGYGTDLAKQEESPMDYNYMKAGWFKNFEDFNDAHLSVMKRPQDIPLNDPTSGQAVDLLKKNGYNVVAVTARREEWRDGTLEFFKKNNIDIQDKELIFSDRDAKADTVDYDYILDDAPKNIIETLQKSDAEPVVYTQRYNEHVDGLKRVGSVLEFAQYIIDRDKNR